MSESEVQQLVQLEAAKHGCILMRNNSGAFKDETGRLIRFGLGNVSKRHSDYMKSPDLVGIYPITITPEMVGQKIGVFVGVECKPSDWEFKKSKREVAQLNWIQWAESLGALADFASSPLDILKLLKIK